MDKCPQDLIEVFNRAYGADRQTGKKSSFKSLCQGAVGYWLAAHPNSGRLPGELCSSLMREKGKAAAAKSGGCAVEAKSLERRIKCITC